MSLIEEVTEGKANRSIKIRLFPNKTQQKLMTKNMCVARCAYNWARYQALQEWEKYLPVKDDFKAELDTMGLTDKEKEDKLRAWAKENYPKYISSARDLRNKFTKEVKENKEGRYTWFGVHDSAARNETFVRNFDAAIKSFRRNFEDNKNSIKKKKKKQEELVKAGKRDEVAEFKYPRDYGFPQYKKPNEATSYPTNLPLSKIDVQMRRINIQRIGWVKISVNQELPDFSLTNAKNAQVVISTDKQAFYISIPYYAPNISLNTEKTEIVGIDEGLKDVMIVSDGTILSNPAKDAKLNKCTEKVKKLQRKLAWLQQHSPKFYEAKMKIKEELIQKGEANPDKETNRKWNKEKHKIPKTRQMVKIERLITRITNDMNHYKDNKRKLDCRTIIDKNPKGIVLEHLHIKGMMKNKRVSGTFQKTGMYAYKSTLVNMAHKHNIVTKEVKQNYASTQICSHCGHKETSMRGPKALHKRTFVCSKCGFREDRDINAATNLKNMWNDSSVTII